MSIFEGEDSFLTPTKKRGRPKKLQSQPNKKVKNETLFETPTQIVLKQPTVDERKTLEENYKMFSEFYIEVETSIENLKQKIKSLNDEINDIRKQRNVSRKAEEVQLVSYVNQLKENLRDLENNYDPTEFYWNVAKVLRDEDDKVEDVKIQDQGTKHQDEDEDCLLVIKMKNGVKHFISNKNNERNPFEEGQKDKKKKPKNKLRLEEEAQNSLSSIITSAKDTSGSKKLAALCDKDAVSNFSTSGINMTCVVHTDVKLCYSDHPPRLYCPTCGLVTNIIEAVMNTIQEKENNSSGNQYTSEFHFKNLLQKFLDEQVCKFPPQLKDDVRYELDIRGVKQVSLVTCGLVYDIVQYLVKIGHSEYARYYSHVWQLTGEIRGAPIVSFKTEQKQEILDFFPQFFEIWKQHKHEIYPEDDRRNFVYNSLALQIIFKLLGYPDSIIALFNGMKGDKNNKEYNTIIEFLCERFKRPIFTVDELNSYRHGQSENIIEQFKQMNEGEAVVVNSQPQNDIILCNEEDFEEMI